MIVYLCSHGQRAVMSAYLGYWGRDVAEHFNLMSYRQLFRSRRLHRGSYIFSDIERLSAPEREKVAVVWNELRNAWPDCRLLNHPLKVMKRYPLLRTLHDSGINAFTAYRYLDNPRPDRFPVFIKRENDHLQPESGLLNSQVELDSCLDSVSQFMDPSEILVVEFHNKTDSQGRFWKYSAFVFENTIVPGHIFVDSNWYVKQPAIVDQEIIDAELKYVQDNPHDDVLRRAAALANIDYGRVDYNVVDGQVQVYEINTHPFIMGRRDGFSNDRADAREKSAANIASAFIKLRGANADKAKISTPRLSTKFWWADRGLAYSLCSGVLRFVGLGRLVHILYVTLDDWVVRILSFPRLRHWAKQRIRSQREGRGKIR